MCDPRQDPCADPIFSDPALTRVGVWCGSWLISGHIGSKDPE